MNGPVRVDLSSARLKELVCVAYIAYIHGDQIGDEEAEAMRRVVMATQPESLGVVLQDAA
jgi:hypothetical protein